MKFAERMSPMESENFINDVDTFSFILVCSRRSNVCLWRVVESKNMDGQDRNIRIRGRAWRMEGVAGEVTKGDMLALFMNQMYLFLEVTLVIR